VTAYAISFARERVVIAADTVFYLPDRQAAPPRILGYGTKVHPLAHLRAAIFGRGIGKLITETAGLVLMAPHLDSIERVAGTMPQMLRAVTGRYCRSAGIDDPSAYGMAEVYLVGWSEADRRMRFWVWGNIDDWHGFADDGSGTLYRMLAMPPLPDDEMPARRGSLDAHLVAVMAAERRFFEARPECGVMVGGEVQAWQITRNGISQRVIHRFPDLGRPRDTGLLARLASGAERIDMTERLFTAAEMRDPRGPAA
jgi:hypothetical protein